MIRGLAKAFSPQFIVALDAHLRARGTGPVRISSAACTLLRRGAGAAGTLQIECTAGEMPDGGFALSAILRQHPDGRVDGTVEWLHLADGSYSRLGVSGRMHRDDQRLRVVARLMRTGDGGRVRAPSGDRIEALEFRWDRHPDVAGRRRDIVGEIRMTADFRPLTGLMGTVAGSPDKRSNPLAGRFDARALEDWLLDALGAPPLDGCCATAQPAAPVPDVDGATRSVAGTLSAALERRGPRHTFEFYCGVCHGNDTRHPPGFLHGTPDVVSARLDHCAPRIFYRLSMWHRAAERRGVPPMPPPQGLSLAGTDAESWRRGESLARLIDHAGGRIEGQGVRRREVLAKSYPQLRACLPAVASPAQ